MSQLSSREIPLCALKRKCTASPCYIRASPSSDFFALASRYDTQLSFERDRLPFVIIANTAGLFKNNSIVRRVRLQNNLYVK